MGNNALVGIEERVKDKCLQGCIFVSLRGRNTLDDGIEDFLNANAGFRRSQHRIRGIKTNGIFDFFLYPVRVSTWQVNLIDDRYDFQIIFKCHIDIRKRLRFNALRRIHDQQRPFTGGQTAGNLIGKVHMARRVDEV